MLPVAIKSHKRCARLREYTYECVLNHYGFKLNHVHIFVSRKEDVRSYEQEFPSSHIHLAPLGIAAVDDHITGFFARGQPFVHMIDDVSSFHVKSAKKLQEGGDLLGVFRKLYSRALESDATQCGFHPSRSAKWMSHTETTNLCLITDGVPLVFNTRKIRITRNCKDDYEKSISLKVAWSMSSANGTCFSVPRRSSNFQYVHVHVCNTAGNKTTQNITTAYGIVAWCDAFSFKC